MPDEPTPGMEDARVPPEFVPPPAAPAPTRTPPHPPGGPLTALRWSSAQVGVFLAYVAAVLVVSPLARSALSRFPGDLQHVVAALVIASCYVLIFIPVWLSARRHRVRLPDAVGLRHTPAWPVVGGAVLTAATYWWFTIMWVLALMAARVHLPSRAVYVTRLFGSGVLGFVISVVLVAVIVPIAEESIFRGVMYAQLREAWGTVPAALVSALVFAALHLNGIGFVPLAGVALVFAYLFTRSRSLWSSIAAHAAVNFSLIVVQYATGAGLK